MDNKKQDNKKQSIIEKISSVKKVYIKDFSSEYGNISNEDFLNLKTERYEKALKIRRIFSIMIGLIIGALCVCFGWIVSMFKTAWEHNAFTYIFDTANSITYAASAICIVLMIALFIIKNKFFEKTDIIQDIREISGTTYDVSRCLKLLNNDKFKDVLLDFVREILDDKICINIHILKNNKGEYLEKKDEVQKELLKIFKDENFEDRKTIHTNVRGSIIENSLTISMDQLHKLFQVLIKYKNHTIVYDKTKYKNQIKPGIKSGNPSNNPNEIAIHSAGLSDLVNNQDSEFLKANNQVNINLTISPSDLFSTSRTQKYAAPKCTPVAETTQTAKEVKFSISDFLNNLCSDLSDPKHALDGGNIAFRSREV